MEYHSIFKKYSLKKYIQSGITVIVCLVLIVSAGCTSAIDIDTVRKVTTIDSVKKAEPFVVNATYKFYEVGLIQDATNPNKIDSYNDEWLYLPGSITAIIDTSASTDTLWLDIALESDPKNPTRQRPRQEVVTSMRIRLNTMPTKGTYPLLFAPNVGTGSLIITLGAIEPQKTYFGKVLVSFSTIEKINDGKNSKLTMAVQATVPSASKSFTTFNFQGEVVLLW